MGLVYVVGFCTTDFPDGTTGSVPDAWAWAALARTSDPTSANRTDRNNVFIRLPLWTQRTVTWLSDGTTGHLLSSRTNWRSFVSLSRYGQLGPPACSRDHGTSGVAAKSQRASRRRCGVLETMEQPGRPSSGDRPVHLGRLDARGRPDRGRGAGRARHQGVGRGRPAGSGPRSGTPSRIAGRDPSWPSRLAGGAHVPGRDRADAAAPLPRRRPRTGSVTGSAGSEHSRSARDGGRRPNSSARGRRGRLRTGGRLAYAGVAADAAGLRRCRHRRRSGERTGLPVRIGNDATLGALAEWRLGAGTAVDDLV